jgi:putative aldouronate transport system permease protein
MGAAPRRRTPRQGISVWRQIRRDWALILLAAPGLLWILVFQYVPLLGNVIAFQDYLPFLGITGSDWIGFENFRAILTTETIVGALRNTLVISVIQIVFFFPAPIMLAMLLHSVTAVRVRRLIQNVVYLPHFIGWVVVVALFQQILGGDGLISRFVQGSGGGPVNIMGNPSTFPLLVALELIWREAGWAAIIYLAALISIDPALYEAASADGANRWQRMWHVTLPGIAGITVVLLLLRIGNILTVGFEQILLQRDFVGFQAGEVLDTWVYYHGLVGGDWGLAAAAGLLKGVFGAALLITMNRVAHRFGSAGLYR